MTLRVRRKALASWKGSVPTGSGSIKLGSGAFEGSYSLRSRIDENGDANTNPEELIGAGLAGCFAMSLSSLLGDEGHDPERIDATATVHLEEQSSGFSVTKIELEVAGEVEGVSEERLIELATQAKETCPISRALAGTEVVLLTSNRS